MFVQEREGKRSLERHYNILAILEGNIVGGCSLDSSLSGQGIMAGSCVRGNEPSGSIESEDFLEYLRDLTSQEGLCSVESFS
jgi:hypothetical protein